MNLQSGEHKPGQGTGAPGQGWKSFSLQRGVAPPSGEEAEHNGSIITNGSPEHYQINQVGFGTFSIGNGQVYQGKLGMGIICEFAEFLWIARKFEFIS